MRKLEREVCIEPLVERKKEYYMEVAEVGIWNERCREEVVLEVGQYSEEVGM